MDEIITQILKDHLLRWRIILILFNAFLSALFAIITQDIFHTIIFVIITAILDVLVEAYEFIKFDSFIKKLFCVKQPKRYITLIIFACLPTIGAKYIDRICNYNDYKIQIFNNLVPNILGALIICSMFDHIKKFSFDDMISSLVKTKKELINVFFRISLFASYINALNYQLSNNWKWMNIINSVYIFIITVYGAIVFTTFALRIIDETPFRFKTKQIYPTWTMFYGTLFLISCGSVQLIVHTRKIETILLLFNSLTACAISIGLLFLISHRKENISDTYPIKRILVFIFFIVINLLPCFFDWDIDDEIKMQLLSGIIIFTFTLVIILFINVKQSKNITKKHNRKDKRRKSNME